MCQPTYDDMGKICKDFFGKGYYINVFKLTAKKQATFSGVDATIGLLHNFEDQTCGCDYENKFVHKPWGLTTSAKIDSKSLFGWKADICDKIAKGLKLSLDTSYNLDSAEKKAKFNAMYKIPVATIDLGVQGGEGEDANLTVNGSAVAGVKLSFGKILGGYQAAFDTNEGTLKKNNVALGFETERLNILANLENAEALNGIIHYKCSDGIEGAINGTYNMSDDSKTVYGVGLKFTHGPCTAFKAKIDSNKAVTVACEMKACDAALLTLCAECGGDGTGKVGCGLEFGPTK